MKSLIIKRSPALIVLIVFALTPFGVLAADMWAETPDLNEESEIASVTVEKTTIVNKSPAVDLWAETPDLLARDEDHGVVIDAAVRVSNQINVEMYAETPDLNKVETARRIETPIGQMIAVAK